MSADSERGVLGNAAGFLTGVGQGLWSAGKATVVGAVEGVSAVGQAGYQLATDPQYRGEVWRSTVEGARAVRDYAGEAVRDPSRVVRDVREGAGAAIDTAGTMLHELNEERKKAAAEGRSAEFYGNITGKVAFELIPAGKVGKALGVVGKSGKLGKVAGALDKLDDLGDGVKALDKVQDVAKAGKKLDRALDGKKAVKGIGKAKAKKATANAKSAKGKKGKGKKSTKKPCDKRPKKPTAYQRQHEKNFRKYAKALAKDPEKARAVWTKLHPLERGKVIQRLRGATSHSKYFQTDLLPGFQNARNFKTIDFVSKDLKEVVSLKTIDPSTKNFRSTVAGYVREMKNFKISKLGANEKGALRQIEGWNVKNERSIQRVLDLCVPRGQTERATAELMKIMQRTKGVTIRVTEFP